LAGPFGAAAARRPPKILGSRLNVDDDEEEEELRAYEEEAEEEEEEEVQGNRNTMAMLEAAGAEHRYPSRSRLLLRRSIFRSILLLLVLLECWMRRALDTGMQERERESPRERERERERERGGGGERESRSRLLLLCESLDGWSAPMCQVSFALALYVSFALAFRLF
jgi:hypothetical protein